MGTKKKTAKKRPAKKRAAKTAKKAPAKKRAAKQSGTKSGDEAAAKPRKKTRSKKKGKRSSATVGFEAKLWEAADKLRGSMDSAEYKHVVLGLIFLKYISDAFEVKRGEVERTPHADPEDRDEYDGDNVFWVPKKARWEFLRAQARKPEIGVLIDSAMELIEKENKSLRATLPKNYARPALDKTRLGELIDLMSDIGLVDVEGEHRSTDMLGRVYEYFLSRFASAEGKGGGEFYTPQSVVRLLVEMIEPYKGRVYDPCCGSGGMFVQSEKFVEEHGGRKRDLAIYGQEWNATTWKLAKMNLAIRGIEANLGDQWADAFSDDKHKGLKADFILANPPFNVSDWGGQHLKDDPRWKYGVPPTGNANYAWLQHIVSKLSPKGVAGVVLANGSMSSMQSGEGVIRRSLIDANLIDCMVAMPSKLFYTRPISVCLWILSRTRQTTDILFIDARELGHMVDRTHRVLSDEETRRVADTYSGWRRAPEPVNEPGFCRSATLADLKAHDFVLTPGRYVDVSDMTVSVDSFDDQMARLLETLRAQMESGTELEFQLEHALSTLGYEL